MVLLHPQLATRYNQCEQFGKWLKKSQIHRNVLFSIWSHMWKVSTYEMFLEMLHTPWRLSFSYLQNFPLLCYQEEKCVNSNAGLPPDILCN